MLRDLAVARIQRGLGFRSDLSDTIVLAMQEAQRLLELGSSLPWFLLQEDQDLVLAAGTAQISLPTGFIREKADERPRLVNSSTQKKYFLEKLDNDVALLRFNAADPGKPLAYVTRVSGLDVYPERDIEYTAIWSYYKKADALTTNIENAWLANASECLIGSAGMSIAADLRNGTALEIFTKMFSLGWTKAFNETILREEEARPSYVGGKL